MSNLFIVVVLALVAILIFRSAGKILFRFIGFLFLIGAVAMALYHFRIGPFAQNNVTLAYLQSKYCIEKNSVECQCIVQPIEADMKGRFSSDELQNLENDQLKASYVLHKSLKVLESDIKNCLNEKGDPKMLKEFKAEAYNIDNPFFRKTADILEDFKEKSKEKLNNFLRQKEDVDQRY